MRALPRGLGIRGYDASAGVGKCKKVRAADIPEFDRAVLDGEIISAGHQRFESGQFGEEGIFALECCEALVLQILEGDYGVLEVARKIVSDLSAPALSNDQGA